MAGIDKAAIGFTIAIVAIGVGFAFIGDNNQNASFVSPPTLAAPTTSPEEPKAQTDPFAEIAEKVKEEAPIKPIKGGWDRLESATDPGVGHEQHQLAVILPPSGNVYSGTLNYDASEKVQLVALHGPLADGDDKGQAIWTPDGETKFALTFVDQDMSSGEWKFAGNALAVHTMNPTPFIVDYQVDYKENPKSEMAKTGTIQSIQDPGIGHESHQLAVILGPSSDLFTGTLSYSASEPIQLVSLRGPIGPDETPEKTWTPDGETIYELTFVDRKTSMGSWKFSGNALAVHTMNPTEFTVSYSVNAKTSAVKPTTEVMEKPATQEMEKPAPVETSGPQTLSVDIPSGTAVPGCEETDECYLPSSVTIKTGDTVEWTNSDTAAHTVTAGTPADGPSGVFDSSLVLGGATYAFTFDESGSYNYFCMVHPWMVGNVQVN